MLSKAELARGLGVTVRQVYRLTERGMPWHSLALAQRWRALNVEPRVRASRREALLDDEGAFAAAALYAEEAIVLRFATAIPEEQFAKVLEQALAVYRARLVEQGCSTEDSEELADMRRWSLEDSRAESINADRR